MDIQVNRADLLTALQALRPYFASNNEWPFVSFAPGQEGIDCLIYGLLKTGAAVTCYNIASSGEDLTEAVGFAGSMVEALVKATSGETVRLRATESNLFIEDEHKFRGRLARSTAMTSMLQPVLDKRSKTETTLSATLPKDSLERLLSLSLAFPGVGVNELRWCALAFDSGKCSGSAQKSELGEIESMPMGATNLQGEGTLYLTTGLFKIAQTLAREFVLVQAGQERYTAAIVSDPDNPVWWTMVAPFRLPGEE